MKFHNIILKAISVVIFILATQILAEKILIMKDNIREEIILSEKEEAEKCFLMMKDYKSEKVSAKINKCFEEEDKKISGKNYSRKVNIFNIHYNSFEFRTSKIYKPYQLFLLYSSLKIDC